MLAIIRPQRQGSTCGTRAAETGTPGWREIYSALPTKMAMSRVARKLPVAGAVLAVIPHVIGQPVIEMKVSIDPRRLCAPITREEPFSRSVIGSPFDCC